MLTNQFDKFSLPQGRTYLNCAYMSPLLKTVEEAGIAGIKGKTDPTSISPADFFGKSEQLRQEFAKLIHCPDPTRVAIIPSASYGIATVAKNITLEASEKVVVAAEQFPSNYYSWKSLTEKYNATLQQVAPPLESINRGELWNIDILKAIDDSTKVVALPHIHWADGTRFDLVSIKEKCSRVGALLIIDGTQSVGALPFDIRQIQPDALICAGYKWLLGPYSIGLAYYGEAFNEGTPLEENWINRLHSEDFGGLVNYEDNYQPGAQRYDVGERSNFILLPMMLEALKQINEWTPEGIQDYCKAISETALDELRHSGYQIENSSYRSHHLFGIRSKQKKLSNELHKVLIEQQIFLSTRGDAIRVSPHVYNSQEDIEKLVTALKSL